MTDYTDQPDIMAIGDSMYQGIRSLSFIPAIVANSGPAQVARAIGMRMTVPDLQVPLLFDLEAELRKGGLVNLVEHIRTVALQNLVHWPLDRLWSQHQAFDNISIGGAEIADLLTATSAAFSAKIPGLIATLNAHPPSVAELAATIGNLWYAMNNCYMLNPQHRSQQDTKAPIDQVEDRQPQILLINIGSNEGLFKAGFTGDFSDATMQSVAAIPGKLRPLADRLARLPARTEKIVFNSLIKPRFIPNLMPGDEFFNQFPGDGYFQTYGPRISSTQQTISGDQLRAFDALIARVNGEAADILRSAVGDRIVFADVYGACPPLDGKHYQGRGLAIPRHNRTLNNLPLAPSPFGSIGGLAGLDNMHPTVPGYAAIADTVLDALGRRDIRTDKQAAFAADTLLADVSLAFVISGAELSLIGIFGAFRSSAPGLAPAPAAMV